MFCHPILRLDHPNVLSYVDNLRRDANVDDWVAIIGAGGVEFDENRWTEDWGMYGTNDDRDGAASAIHSQRRRG